jgi:RHH-type rel operon transcriptional repressor/antitoxin RelB
MAVSVRMEPLLEKELEQAARRQGITKSQFIVEAVERALGRKDPAALYRKVMQEAAVQYKVSENLLEADTQVQPYDTGSSRAALVAKLRARHAASTQDWLAYQEARKRGVAWAPDDEKGLPA